MRDLTRENLLIESGGKKEEQKNPLAENFLKKMIIPIMTEKGYERIESPRGYQNPLPSQKFYFRKPIVGAPSYFYNVIVGIRLDMESPHIGIPSVYLCGDFPVTTKSFFKEINSTNFQSFQSSLRHLLKNYETEVDND